MSNVHIHLSLPREMLPAATSVAANPDAEAENAAGGESESLEETLLFSCLLPVASVVQYVSSGFDPDWILEFFVEQFAPSASDDINIVGQIKIEAHPVIGGLVSAQPRRHFLKVPNFQLDDSRIDERLMEVGNRAITALGGTIPPQPKPEG